MIIPDSIVNSAALTGLAAEDLDITVRMGMLIIRPKVTVTVEDAWQRLISNEALKRAIEVALAGGHSIGVICSTSCQKDLLMEVMPSASICSPCKCGWLTDRHHPCSCSLRDVSKHRQTKAVSAVMDSTIIVQMVPPSERDRVMIGRLEPFSAMIDRVHNAYKGLMMAAMSEDSVNLLRVAIERLHIPHRRDRIIAVAETIARLDGSATVVSHHIAEAVQYNATYQRDSGSFIAGGSPRLPV